MNPNFDPETTTIAQPCAVQQSGYPNQAPVHSAAIAPALSSYPSSALRPPSSSPCPPPSALRPPSSSPCPPSSASFIIPPSDHDLFASLNDRARKLVKRRLRAMQTICRSANPWSGAQAVAAMFHGERGWSAKRLSTLYSDFTESGGNWRSLVDSSLAGLAWQNHMSPIGLPDAFLDWLAQQWAQNQRDKFMSVYNQLLMRYRRWRAGDDSCAIPGYNSCPEPNSLSVADLPAGWTYSNLKISVNGRISKFARKLVQIGPKASSALGPQVLTTRAGLELMQYCLIDDSWNDFKVLGFGQTCRLLGYHWLELASGCHIAHGEKPALRDEETHAEERLKEKELVWLLVHVLTSIGYRAAGTTIIGEKATSRIRSRELGILADCGIPVTFQSGPAGGGPGIAASFTGPSGGNPRWKAPLESWFNLLRNRTADLLEFPGQTGSNSRINKPEGLAGVENDTLALVKAVRAMTPEKAELMRLGMLPVHEAIFRLDAIIEVINCRIDHSLEGWRDCGHYTTEWRLPSPLGRGLGEGDSSSWLPVAKLLDFPPEDRNAIAAVLNNSPASKRERALSPREVFDAGKSSLVKLPMAVASLLMDDIPGIERPVKNNQIELSIPEVDPDEPLVFGLTRRDGRGISDPLRNDDKYLVRVNPLDPRVAWLYTASNQFAGVAPFYGRARRDDPHAMHAAFAAKRKALAPMIEEGRRAAANITRDATDRAAANAQLLGPTPTKAAEAKQLRADESSAHNALLKSADNF